MKMFCTGCRDVVEVRYLGSDWDDSTQGWVEIYRCATRGHQFLYESFHRPDQPA